MAVEYPTARVSYKGNGSTRTFSFNFPIRKEEHLQVTTTNLTTMEVKILNLGADYDVVPIDNTYPSDGGSINYPRDISTPSLAEGMSITITRVVPYTQPDIYSENSTLIPKQIENSLDNLEYQIQQINDKADSSVRIPDGVDYSNDEFVSELFDKAKLAEQSAINAKASETNAKSSATSASQSAQTATTKAQEAQASATSANQSAQTATTKASEAEASATSASQSAQTATTKAQEAKESATSANQSAQTATTKASEASQSAQTATTKAQEAKESATNAKESEDKALEYAKRAEQASGSAGNPVSDVVVEDNKITVTKGVGGSTEYTVNNVENAVNAKLATKAEQDSEGNAINMGSTMNIKTLTEPLDDWHNLKTGIYAVDVTNFFASSTLHKPPVPQGGICMAYITDTDAQIEFYPDNYNGNPSAPKCVLRKVSGSWKNWYTEVAPIFLFVSPAMKGKPTAPTASVDTNTTQLATCEFVKNQKYLQREDTINAQELDFNSYTVDGMYNYGGTFTNSYSDGSVFGTLVVLNNLYNGSSGTSGTYISQTAHDANGDIYVRYRNGTDDWSAWRKFLKEPTRTVLMDTWINHGDIELSESWRNFDELVFACTDDDKTILNFVYVKTADLANWLSDDTYPSHISVSVKWDWRLTREGTTDTILKLNQENSAIAKIIGIKY